MSAPQLSALEAGEDLDALASCYQSTADGLIYMSDGTAANEAAKTRGFTPEAYKQGDQHVTLIGKGAKIHYADGTLTPGQRLYVAATPGRLDTAATTGDATGVAEAYTTSDIQIIRDA